METSNQLTQSTEPSEPNQPSQPIYMDLYSRPKMTHYSLVGWCVGVAGETQWYLKKFLRRYDTIKVMDKHNYSFLVKIIKPFDKRFDVISISIHPEINTRFGQVKYRLIPCQTIQTNHKFPLGVDGKSKLCPCLQPIQNYSNLMGDFFDESIDDYGNKSICLCKIIYPVVIPELGYDKPKEFNQLTEVISEIMNLNKIHGKFHSNL
jgi:hypothetical protein